MKPRSLYQTLTQNKEPNFYRERFLDGWVSVVKPIDPSFSLGEYRLAFMNNPVDAEIMNTLISQVEEWARSGVKVYAFRPPTTYDMVAMENELSGFDEGEFRLRYETAGGKWIEVDQCAYLCYDGSHLHRDGAVAFSHDLAKKIQVLENASK